MNIGNGMEYFHTVKGSDRTDLTLTLDPPKSMYSSLSLFLVGC